MMSSEAGRIRSTILILIAVLVVGAAGVFYLTRRAEEAPATPSDAQAVPVDDEAAVPRRATVDTGDKRAPRRVPPGTAAPDSPEAKTGLPDARRDDPAITTEPAVGEAAPLPRSFEESPSSSAARGSAAGEARGSVSSGSTAGAVGGSVAAPGAEDRLSGSSASGSRADTLTVFPDSSGTAPAAGRSTETARAEAPETAPQQIASERGSYTPAGDPPDAPPVGAIPTVRMVASAGYASVGELVTVLVTIDGATDVGHTPFHVLYNPAVLRFVAGDEGGFLGSDGQQTAFFATATSDGASVVVGLSRLGRVPGVGGSGELCRLHFEVVGPGNAGLAFSRAKVRDSSNRIVSAIFEPASIIGS